MSLLAPLSVNSFALLFVSHMAVEKKFLRVCQEFWGFFNVKSLTRGSRSKPHTHKDEATNYSICLSIQLKPFDREFLKVCLVKNKAITTLTDRSLR